jgi:hypothetical protein
VWPRIALILTVPSGSPIETFIISGIWNVGWERKSVWFEEWTLKILGIRDCSDVGKEGNWAIPWTGRCEAVWWRGREKETHAVGQCLSLACRL